MWGSLFSIHNRLVLILAMVLVQAGCGGGGDGSSGGDNDAITYTIGGTVYGLIGTLVLQNNGGDDLSVTKNGSFTFTTSVNDSASYNISIVTQPTRLICSVRNGSGTVNSSNITRVAVYCISDGRYTIGGAVSGLEGAVILQNNKGDDLTISNNGRFEFVAGLDDGAAYSVTVKTQPNNQLCTIGNGAGNVNRSNVIDIVISCGDTGLPPPTNHHASSNFGAAIRHTWDPVPGAESYIIYNIKRVYDYEKLQYVETYRKIIEVTDTFYEYYTTSTAAKLVVKASSNGKLSAYSQYAMGTVNPDYYPELYAAPKNLRASKGEFSDQIKICWDYSHVPADYYDDNRGAIVVKMYSTSNKSDESLLTSAWLSYTNNNCVNYNGRTAGPVTFTAQYQNTFVGAKSTVAATQGYTATLPVDTNNTPPNVNATDKAGIDAWNTAGDVDSFNMYIETADGSNIYRKYKNSLFYKLTRTGRDFFERGVYRYKIRSVINGKESDFSDVIEVNPSTMQTFAVTHTEFNGKHIFSWDPSYFEKFVIYYSYQEIVSGRTFFSEITTGSEFVFPYNYSKMYVNVYAFDNIFGNEILSARGKISIIVIPDTDNDNVKDDIDLCPNTKKENRNNVDSDGCSTYQKGDADKDSVMNAIDLCPQTILGEAVNGQGCSDYDLFDKDRDNILDTVDRCLNTQIYPVDSSGCSIRQASDDDLDGVNNYADLCPSTPTGESVNAYGCSVSQKTDSDGDGVMDAYDICPSTTADASLDIEGCVTTQRIDTDRDAVFDYLDQCLKTPVNESVDSLGCSQSQKLDNDGDGLVDAYDKCASTPAFETVNIYGCSESQLDISSPINNFSAFRYWSNDRTISIVWSPVPSAKEYRIKILGVEIIVSNDDPGHLLEHGGMYATYRSEQSATVEIQAFYLVDGLLVAGEKSSDFVESNNPYSIPASAPDVKNANTTSTSSGSSSDGTYETTNTSATNTGFSAASCIQLGLAFEWSWSKAESKYIENTCDAKVLVRWCHTGSGGDNSAVCGGPQYYQKRRVLNPGQRYFNMFSIPNVSDYSFAACHGIRDFESNSDGSYSCP